MRRHYVGISISELQQWLADGQLPVSFGRDAYTNNFVDVESEASETEALLRRLPAFSLDDPAGVLIANVEGPAAWRQDRSDPGIRYLDLSAVIEFIPLTEDARIALNSRFSSTIKLSLPKFAAAFERFRYQEKATLSGRSGNIFANLLIEFLTEFSADKLLLNSLPRALMGAEHRSNEEVRVLLGMSGQMTQGNWMEMSFNYTRRDTFDRIPENAKALGDLGKLLKLSNGDLDGLIGELRGIVSRLIERGNKYSLADVYSDSEFFRLSQITRETHKDRSSVTLISIALFLRWKQDFHDKREQINLLAIANDVGSLVGRVDVNQVAIALWMFGAFVGMDRIVPLYRAIHKEQFPALVFASNDPGVKPVPAWNVVVGSQQQKLEGAGAGNSVGDALVSQSNERSSATDEILDSNSNAAIQEVSNSHPNIRSDYPEEVHSIARPRKPGKPKEESSGKQRKQRAPKIKAPQEVESAPESKGATPDFFVKDERSSEVEIPPEKYASNEKGVTLSDNGDTE